MTDDRKNVVVFHGGALDGVRFTAPVPVDYLAALTVGGTMYAYRCETERRYDNGSEWHLHLAVYQSPILQDLLRLHAPGPCEPSP